MSLCDLIVEHETCDSTAVEGPLRCLRQQARLEKGDVLGSPPPAIRHEHAFASSDFLIGTRAADCGVAYAPGFWKVPPEAVVVGACGVRVVDDRGARR